MKTLMKTLLPIGIVAIMGTSLTATAWAGETLDRVMKTKTLTLSSDPGYPPQSFLNDQNEMDGFDVDVAREIAKRMGAQLKVITPSWEVITAGNWGGRWDISVGSMTPTKERAQVLDFPAIYYYTPANFAVHQDSKVKSISELNGKKIGVCGGCTYDSYLDKKLTIDAEGTPKFDFKVTPGEKRTYETDTSAFDDLRLGDGVRLDAVFSALPTILEAVKNNYPLRVLPTTAFYEPLAVAVDKGDEAFSAKVKEIVGDMHADGTLTKLSMKWYNADLTKAQ